MSFAHGNIFAPACMANKPHLFIDVQHGLCNRLRALVSAAAIAERTDRNLVVIWRPDHHCQARIGDLLNYTGIVVEDDAADVFRKRAGLQYNYMEIEADSCFEEPILPDGPAHELGDVYIRSAYTLNSPHRTHMAEQKFLRNLRPVEAVVDLVASVRHPNDIAAHIRMGTGPKFDHLSYESPNNWPEQRHKELAEWRRKSDITRFIRRFDSLIESGDAETIFVAADLARTYTTLSDRYGKRVVYLKRRLFDRSAEQMQYALADLILLASAPRMLASTWSSFSDTAQRLAPKGRPVEQSGKDF